MRAFAALVAAALAVAGGASALGRKDGPSAARAAPRPPPLVACDSVVLRPQSVSPGDRVVFGRVAFVWRRVLQVADVGGDGSLRLFAKVGLYVRAGRAPVTLAVPIGRRGRAGISWGTGIVTALRIAGCPSPSRTWNGYAGGFYVREPACVPLLVRVRERRALLRFGVGRPCHGTGAKASHPAK